MAKSHKRYKQGYDSNFCGIVDIASQFDYFLYRLISIGISCYTWTGLPDTIDERFLETNLLYRGNMLYFNDEILGDLALKCNTSAPFTVYDIPAIRHVYTASGYQATRTYKDSVLMFDNYLHRSTLPILEMFAKKLCNLEITKDINIRAQKTPILLQCEDGQRLTLENLFMKIDCGTPVIFGTKNLDLSGLQVIDLRAPYVVDKLQDEKMNVLHEAFSFLGVGNLEVEKRERMIQREVQTANDANIAQRASRLKARKQAAKEINNMFFDGEEQVKVEYNPAVEEEAKRFIDDLGDFEDESID